MKHHQYLILVALLCLLIAPAAADVSDSTVISTNIYAGSYVFDIAPAENVTSSTATGISNVAGRYIYASALDNSVSESTATLILLDRQGATVNLTDSAVVSGLLVDWGDGSTSDSLTHEYTSSGIYNVTATISNYLDQTGITLTDRVQIGETSISISVSPAVLTTSQSWSLTADAVIADTVQWQVSRNNATWTDIPEGTYTPTEYGQYFFRAIAYGADVTVVSNVVQTEYRYAVTDSTVTNTNIYAGSNVYSIAPDGYYDSASSATGISSVAGRYIYASALGNTVNESTATLILMDRQGATVNVTDSTVVSGLLVDWGDGSTSDSLTHEYTSSGIYNVTATISNYLDQTGITLTDRVQIGETSISISVSPAVLTTGQSWSLTADAVIADTVQWQVSRNNATWTDIPEGTYTPAEYGQYFFRAIAYGADVTVVSNVVQTEYRYAVTDSTVTNTNIYAGSNVYSIAPDGYYDSASTASGITNVAGRYLYASALEVIENGRTAIYNIIGLQGSTTTLTDGRITQGYLWDYGDNTTSTTTQLTHTYGAPGKYVTTLGLTNYLDTTGVSLTGDEMYVGPIVGALTADKTAGALGETFNITANVTNYTSIDWYLARYSDGQWYVITDAHGTTLNHAPNQYGDWYFRAKATNSQTGFSQYTDTIKITVYRPPTILNTAINPANGPLTNTITLSATVETPGGTPQLQWQKSSDGTTWTNIEGATTSTWVGSQTFTSGKHYYRLTATGAGGTSYGPAVTYTAYGAPVFSSVQASASIVALPGSVTLTASASDTNTYTWQELKSGNWVNVGNGKELYLKLSSAGIHTYRVVAVGFGGTTTSQTISVDAGYAPNIKIISPKPGEDINLGSNVTFTADVIGAVNTEWSFGDTTHEVISQTANTATVLYKDYGYKTITLSGTNKYGSGSSTVTIIVVSGWERPMATTPINPVDTTPVKNFTDSFNVPQGEILDLPAVFGALTAPMSDLLPDGMFMVIVFGVIFIMLWIMTKNTAVPSIIGLIFGGFILALLPANYYGAAVAILAISIVGGVIRVFIPPK